jgi:serine/threonine protein kinase
MFNPTLKTQIAIGDTEYTFAPHPVVPTLVWGQEGRHAIVYRIEPVGYQRGATRALGTNGGYNGAYALKIFRPAFRHPGLLESAEALAWAHELPGMRVCDQRVITRESYPELVARYEDFNYAMLMPWIDGQTWFDYLSKRERTTLDQSRALAESLAWVLYALELNHLAHCDLSSGNVIIDPAQDSIHLVDVEDLYSPWLTPPPMVPAGSPGYQHRDVASSGQWGPTADRFAGAVLICEMLAWAHPAIREDAWAESYFAPDELQQDTLRYRRLVEVLQQFDPAFAEVFEAAWRSTGLENCPPIKDWYDLMDSLPRDPVARWAPIDAAAFEGETPPPPELALPVSPPVAVPAGKPARRPRQKRQPGQPKDRRGCRVLAILFGLLGLLACYAVGLAVEWSFLQNIF